MISERLTDSMFRFTLSSMQASAAGSKPESITHINHAPIRRDVADLVRSDLPQVVMEGLPLGHSLSIIGKLEIMCDVVRGLAFMHSKGFMHCDIKSLNFLVSEVCIGGLHILHAFQILSWLLIGL